MIEQRKQGGDLYHTSLKPWDALPTFLVWAEGLPQVNKSNSEGCVRKMAQCRHQYSASLAETRNRDRQSSLKTLSPLSICQVLRGRSLISYSSITPAAGFVDLI